MCDRSEYIKPPCVSTVAICHGNKPLSDEKQDSLEQVKPPSDEGGGKTKVLTEGEKEEKLKGCYKTSLPQPR